MKKFRTSRGVIVKSNLELKVANQLEEGGIEYEYEKEKFEWIERISRGYCANCGGRDVNQDRLYTPDFFLGCGPIIEVKGRLTTRDRKLLVGVRTSNPEIDLRLVFDKNNRIRRGSATRYADWAERQGFKYCLGGQIDKSWLQ